MFTGALESDDERRWGKGAIQTLVWLDCRPETGFESLKPTSGPSVLRVRFNFRVARQNEAAGAADAAAWVMSAVLSLGSDKLWVTRRCPCDPSTQNDAGRAPASSLL